MCIEILQLKLQPRKKSSIYRSKQPCLRPSSRGHKLICTILVCPRASIDPSKFCQNNLNNGVAHMYKKSKSCFFADDLAAYQQEVPARDQPVKRLATSLA